MIANPQFGTVVSESGGAYTWARTPRVPPHPLAQRPRHRRQRRGDLPPRRGDRPVLVADAAAGARAGRRTSTRHGFGYSISNTPRTASSPSCAITSRRDAPVKFATLKITNAPAGRDALSVTGYWELVLGELRRRSLMHVVTELDRKTGALFARNAYSPEFADRVAFFDVDDSRRTVTGDRTEFLGRNGTLAHPAALCDAALRAGRRRRSIPVRAMQVPLELEADEERVVIFIARRRTGRRRRAGARAAVPRRDRGRRRARGVCAQWKPNARRGLRRDAGRSAQLPGQRLARLPDARLPHVGAHGFYQSGGAFGFRDQLQDAMALVHAEPRSRASSFCSAPAGSSAKATCSTGGIRRPAAACARTSPTITCGCRSRRAATCTRPATPACSTSASRFSMAGR